MSQLFPACHYFYLRFFVAKQILQIMQHFAGLFFFYFSLVSFPFLLVPIIHQLIKVHPEVPPSPCIEAQSVCHGDAKQLLLIVFILFISIGFF